jgi:hypothetical protein
MEAGGYGCKDDLDDLGVDVRGRGGPCGQGGVASIGGTLE